MGMGMYFCILAGADAVFKLLSAVGLRRRMYRIAYAVAWTRLAERLSQYLTDSSHAIQQISYLNKGILLSGHLLDPGVVGWASANEFPQSKVLPSALLRLLLSPLNSKGRCYAHER